MRSRPDEQNQKVISINIAQKDPSCSNTIRMGMLDKTVMIGGVISDETDPYLMISMACKTCSFFNTSYKFP